MVYLLLADLVVLIHAAFVLFVVLGAVLVWRSPRWAFVHLPCAIYGALIEFVGWYCPLTPLENWLRLRAGAATYDTGFIEHYVMPVLYPEGLTRTVQLVLGLGVVTINAVLYGLVARRRLVTRKPR